MNVEKDRALIERAIAPMQCESESGKVNLTKTERAHGRFASRVSSVVQRRGRSGTTPPTRPSRASRGHPEGPLATMTPVSRVPSRRVFGRHAHDAVTKARHTWSRRAGRTRSDPSDVCPVRVPTRPYSSQLLFVPCRAGVSSPAALDADGGERVDLRAILGFSRVRLVRGSRAGSGSMV
jgi:hypothetical protein